MRHLSVLLLFGLLPNSVSVLAQDPANEVRIASHVGIEIPALDSVKRLDWSAGEGSAGSDFLKRLTIESFGAGSAPTGQGFELTPRLTEGPFTSHGLECPRCVIRPTTDRARFTLPPFGSQATLSASDRVQLFTGLGGVNAWRADNVTVDLDPRGGYRRDRSFNDAWLAQGWAGGNVAIDHNRHVWLGAAGRYLSNLGYGKKTWTTFSGAATFQFGH